MNIIALLLVTVGLILQFFAFVGEPDMFHAILLAFNCICFGCILMIEIIERI